MIRSILVPLSPTHYFDQLVATGIRLSQETGARLYGLGTLDLPEITRPQPVPMGAGGFVDLGHEQHKKNARETLDELRDRFSQACRDKNIAFDCALKSGTPEDEIRKEAHCHDAILMAKDSNFKFATQENSCNTTRHVLQDNPRPVMFVPGSGAPGRILVATDGSTSAARSVQAFLTLGLFENRTVDVLAVAADQNTAERNCYDVASYLALYGIKVVKHPVVSASKPFHVLLDQIRDIPCEAVVMGAFGVTGFKELLFGSATETLLKECTVPLWIHH